MILSGHESQLSITKSLFLTGRIQTSSIVKLQGGLFLLGESLASLEPWKRTKILPFDIIAKTQIKKIAMSSLWYGSHDLNLARRK